jgi:hypothetical protein
MATGTIKDLVLFQSPLVSERKTDYSAQLFEPSVRQINAGYVYSRSFLLPAFLWNGTGGDVAISDIVETLTGGINLTGIARYDIVRTIESVEIVFEVTKYGSLAFTSTFQFVSSCSFDPTVSIYGTRPVISTDQPRPITMTEAMEEAYAYADPMDTIYDTLEFFCGVTNDYVRVVCSDEELVTPQGTFVPCYFGFELPETQGSVRGQMKINVDFLPREAQIWIRTATQSRGKITVTWRQYLGANQEPDAWYPIPLEIMTVEQTPTGVTATALFPDLVNIPFPRRIMTTTELPGGII